MHKTHIFDQRNQEWNIFYRPTYPIFSGPLQETNNFFLGLIWRWLKPISQNCSCLVYALKSYWPLIQKQWSTDHGCVLLWFWWPYTALNIVLPNLLRLLWKTIKICPSIAWNYHSVFSKVRECKSLLWHVLLLWQFCEIGQSNFWDLSLKLQSFAPADHCISMSLLSSSSTIS